MRSSSNSAPGLPMVRNMFSHCARLASRSLPKGVTIAAPACGSGGGRSRSPGVDITEVSERTRCGWRSAHSCAIMPPIDTPNRCADGISSAVSSPQVSSAMSARV